jgi:Patatin-like phospholipase
MKMSEALAHKWQELGPLLQRRFWRPLRSMMEIFHVLPLAAAVILFVLLATDGQFREIYMAYLEVPNGDKTTWLAGIIAALAFFALISAVLYEAHYSLSTMKLNVVYSSYSDPDASSKLRTLQRVAAFALVLVPWLGLSAGLFGARNFVANRYCQLLDVAKVPAGVLHDMQHLLLAGGSTIAAALIFLGAAAAIFSCVDQQNRIAQRVVAFIAPPLAALLFLLFTDKLIPNLLGLWPIVICLFIALLTVLYFLGYQWLYRRRAGFIFTRAEVGSETDSAKRPWLLVAWGAVPSILFSRPEFDTGISLRQRRRRLLIVWAFLPWFLLALYFALVPYFAPATQSADLWAQSQSQSQCPIAGTHVPVPGHWAIFPVAMCCTIGVGLLVGLLLNRLSEQWMWRRIVIAGLVVALAAAARIVSFLDVDTVVSVYRFVGPLGTAALQLLFVIFVFALLAWLSQRSGFPALTLVILAIVVSVIYPDHVGLTAIALGIICVVLALVAALSGLFPVALVALMLPILGIINWHELQTVPVVKQNLRATAGVDTMAVNYRFECWLEQRGIPIPASARLNQQNDACPGSAHSPVTPAGAGATAKKYKNYPVYIIAVEGGGIYAASAAAVFLSKLEQISPDFAEHVFAISGVSGGAIGATIFQALDYAASGHTASPTAASCPKSSAATQQKYQGETLTQKVADIMQDDHFSPVVGSIFSELLGSSTGRAEALVASFEDSVVAHDAAAGRALCAPFADHWTPAAPAPALVLNSTWVETGFRVAFAPFHLNDIDESLYSFSDPLMPDEHDKTLMEAAAVSARFPLILPPFSAVMTDPNTTDRKRWNFVDGGYSDNSGATTALDLYRTLKSVAPQDVDLRIVLITSSDPQPNLRGTDINGTAFRDTMAPINALMKVRANLGNEAVARACTQLYPDDVDFQHKIEAPIGSTNSHPAINSNIEAHGRCIEHAGQPQAPLQIVEIQDQTYGLSLGWKISQTSFAVVSWMLGEPGNCPKDRHASTAATDQHQGDQTSVHSQLTKEIVQRNSCVLKSIIDLVGADRRPQ